MDNKICSRYAVAAVGLMLFGSNDEPRESDKEVDLVLLLIVQFQLIVREQELLAERPGNVQAVSDSRVMLTMLTVTMWCWWSWWCWWRPGGDTRWSNNEVILSLWVWADG